MSESAGDYRKRVLKPFTTTRRAELVAALQELRASPGAPPADLDLLLLYGVGQSDGDAACAKRVAWVHDVWAKSRNNPTYGPIVPMLLELQKLLSALQKPAITEAAFWVDRFAQRSQQVAKKLSALGDLLTNEYGAYGVVTSELLQAAAAASSGIDGVGDAELAKVAVDAGLQVVAPFNIPDVKLHSGLGDLVRSECRSLVDAVFGAEAPPTFKIVDRFEEPGGLRLTPQAVAHMRSEMEKRAHSDHNEAVIKVLNVLASASTEQELHAVVLRHLIAQVESVGTNLAWPLLTRLQEAGVDPVDAGRIVLQLGVKGTRIGPDDVLERIAEGQLAEARRLFDALDGQPGAAVDAEALQAVEQKLDATEARVDELRRESEAATASDDIATATRALTEAARIADDDEQLKELLRSLPPAPPTKVMVSAATDRRLLNILWTPGFGTTEADRYCLVRKHGMKPGHARDGTILAEDLAATDFIDPAPPVGVEVWYGVSVSRGGPHSSVTSDSTVHLPPVEQLEARSDPTSITLTWRQPGGSSAVSITESTKGERPRALQIASPESVTSSGLITGREYTYHVTALYPGGSDGARQAAPVTISAIPREPAVPLKVLSVRSSTDEAGSTMVEAKWRPLKSHSVEIWQFASAPQYAYGARVPLTELAASDGTRLRGREQRRGAYTTVTASAPLGLRHYVAVTLDGSNAIIGPVEALGVCPPVSGAVAERFGNEVVVSWEWPGDEFDVAVDWTPSGKDRKSRGETVVNRTQYHNSGGFRLKVKPGPLQVGLRTVVGDSAQAWFSPHTELNVPGAQCSLSYDVAWKRQFPGQAGRATLTFRSQSPATAKVVVVARAGRYLPPSAEDCVEIGRYTVELEPPVLESQLPVRIPRLGKEYWLRVFADNPTELSITDPPASKLKGR